MTRFLASVLCVLACAQGGSAQGGRLANPGGLADAVAKYPISFGIESPADLLRMVQSCVGLRLQRKDIADAMRILDEYSLQELGFALGKPVTWPKTGIDPTRALRVSILGFGGWLGLPGPILFSAATRRPEVFLDFLSEYAKAELLPVEGKPVVYMNKESGGDAHAFLGGRVYTMSGIGAEKVAGSLREALGDQGHARTISADRAYDLVKGLNRQSLPIALFVNFAAIEAFSGDPSVHLPDSLLVALGPEGLVAGAPLARNSAALALKAGEECRELLARFDPPTFAFSVSLSDPMEDLRHVLAEVWPSALPDLDQLVGELTVRVGMNANTLTQQLEDGAGGLLLYPGSGGQRDPSMVAFVHLQDPAALIDLLSAELPHGGLALVPHSKAEGQFLLRSPVGNGEFVIGVVDDYLLLSNSVKQVDRMAKGTASGWQPRIGGLQLLSAELNPIGLAELLKQNHMEEFIPFVGKVRLFGQVEVKPKGLLARIEPVGDRPGAEMVGDFLEAALFAFVGELGGPPAPEFVFHAFGPDKPKKKK